MKKKNEDETLRITEGILDYSKGGQKTFSIASKIDKGKAMVAESIAGRIKLRRERIGDIEGEEKNINNKLFNCLSPIQLFSEVQVIWTKKCLRQKVLEMRIENI